VNHIRTVEVELYGFTDRQTNLVSKFDGLATGREIAHTPPPPLAGNGDL
jgi:hypothetical protein